MSGHATGAANEGQRERDGGREEDGGWMDGGGIVG